MNYKKTHFLLSVADLFQLPPDEGMEIAIVGRSNAGKSSILNRLTQNKSLARTSKTPGRTQLINLFAIDDKHRIADLPGYGFAKVPLSVKEKWQELITEYLQSRTSLRGLLLVMDCRHPMKDFDRNFLIWSRQCELPVHILLNKADKLSKSDLNKTLRFVGDIVQPYQDLISYQLFSAETGLGLDDLTKKLTHWFSARSY